MVRLPLTLTVPERDRMREVIAAHAQTERDLRVALTMLLAARDHREGTLVGWEGDALVVEVPE